MPAASNGANLSVVVVDVEHPARARASAMARLVDLAEMPWMQDPASVRPPMSAPMIVTFHGDPFSGRLDRAAVRQAGAAIWVWG